MSVSAKPLDAAFEKPNQNALGFAGSHDSLREVRVAANKTAIRGVRRRLQGEFDKAGGGSKVRLRVAAYVAGARLLSSILHGSSPDQEPTQCLKY
jgi:hypothetical protein